MARGDHLFYYRAGATYSHHGIDCGDGTVIHFSTPWMKIAAVYDSVHTPRISRVTWDEFAEGQDVKIREYEEFDHPNIVIARAEARIGEVGYDVFNNNCEHFAVWCKTGKAQSTQSDAFSRAQKLLVKGSPFGLMLLRRARYVPHPYRHWAYGGAVALAGAAFAASYFTDRQRDMSKGVS